MDVGGEEERAGGSAKCLADVTTDEADPVQALEIPESKEKPTSSTFEKSTPRQHVQKEWQRVEEKRR